MLLRFALRRLIRTGTLIVRFPDGTTQRFGDGAPEAGFEVTDWRTVRRLGTHPLLAFGEGYMDGTIRPLDGPLYALLDLLIRNLDGEGHHPGAVVQDWLRHAKRRLDQLNPTGRAQRNVAHHYDLNGRLYALFLDRDRQYSCAYFPTGKETLDEAQALKKRHIAAKLRLDRPGLEILDIGSGWGGMALTLARDFGARVTGITLSTEQLDASRARAAEAGLSDRVQFALMDYRAWDRKVDRIVSVGMFEHVGIGHFRPFFRVVRDALRQDGVALIHAIGRMEGPAATNPWLAKYIFPGGYAPALSEVVAAVEKEGLWITDIEILRQHYALTLAHWRARFAGHRDTIASLYDERFCRMFEFYLTGCELSFRNGRHMNWQLQLTRRATALPITRDYMVEAERAAAWARQSA